MTQQTITADCPECEIAVAEPSPARLGEVVECAGCALELEVVGVEPFALAPAPEVEEDWGE